MELIQTVTATAVDVAAVLFEYFSMLALVYTVICALLSIVRRRTDTGLVFTRGITHALDFKTAAELVRLITARAPRQFSLLAALVLLRLLFTFIIKLETGKKGNMDSIEG